MAEPSAGIAALASSFLDLVLRRKSPKNGPIDEAYKKIPSLEEAKKLEQGRIKPIDPSNADDLPLLRRGPSESEEYSDFMPIDELSPRSEKFKEEEEEEPDSAHAEKPAELRFDDALENIQIVPPPSKKRKIGMIKRPNTPIPELRKFQPGMQEI